jgi:hypothetical protein
MIKGISAIIPVAACALLITAIVPQLSMVEMAFAAAVRTENSAVDQPLAERSCNDFEFWFLNSTCSKVYRKHAARTKHHVATSVPSYLANAQTASAR